MRALFVHDHVFHVGPGSQVFSPGRLPYATFRRYLEEFDTLEVLARSRAIGPSPGSLNQSSGPGVTFTFDHGFRKPADLILRRRGVFDRVCRSVCAADAVIARLPSELGQIAAHCAVRVGRPLVVEVVGCAFDAYWNYGSVIAKAYAPVMYWRMSRAVREAPFALYVTREFLQRRYPCAGSTAAISDVQLRQGSSDTPARIRGGRPEGAHLVLGFIGSLHSRYKGLDTALKALRALRRQEKSVELRVLGDGDQGPWRKLADEVGVSDLVRFYGVLPAGEAVYAWLDEIDLFIQPSRQEGLPRSLLEAMSRGLPAVGSTAGGIPEILPPECMHAPGDWRGLAQRIGEIAWNEQRLTELGIRNWEISRLYLAEKLDRERRAFWRMFADNAVRRAA